MHDPYVTGLLFLEDLYENQVKYLLSNIFENNKILVCTLYVYQVTHKLSNPSKPQKLKHKQPQLQNCTVTTRILPSSQHYYCVSSLAYNVMNIFMIENGMLKCEFLPSLITLDCTLLIKSFQEFNQHVKSFLFLPQINKLNENKMVSKLKNYFFLLHL